MSQKTKKTLPVVIVICLFIPLIIAIIAAIGVDPYDLSASNMETAVLSTPGGVTTKYTDKDTLSLYADITENSVSVDSAILTTYNYNESDAYVITFVEKTGKESVYKLYLSEDTSKCVYVSPDGQYHKINPDIAKKLIQRTEFASVNTSANFPVISAAGLEEAKVLTPSSLSWHYFDASGNPANYENTATVENPIIKFDMGEENSLELIYDRTPDTIKLQITRENGEVVFNDDYSKLSDANLIDYNHDEALSVVATVEWIKTEDSTSWGNATYNFSLLFDILPTYRIVDTKALPNGEFTVLRMSDFNDNEHLFIESSIGIPSEVNVYDAIGKDGKTIKIALIPYGAELEGGEHELVACTEAGQKQTVTINVRKDVPNPQTGIVLDTIRHPNLGTALTKESLSEFDALIDELTVNSVNEQLYDGKFVYPTGSSKVVSGGGRFGMRREFVGSESYTSMGNDLEATAGQDIVAANGGKVVFAGETTLLGNTVIIDHGFSILSYYGNLESINVAVGDVAVKAETVVGKAGSTGFACVNDGGKGLGKTMCHYAVSMNTVFVAPKSVANGIHF